MTDGRFDVIVIGAGPAGSSAAILLARAGHSVALIEKQRFPRRKVCGECIAASNFPLFDALGIGAAVGAAAGPPLRQAAFMQGERFVAAALPEATHDTYRWGRALGRETLDSLMLEAARATGATVLQPYLVNALKGSMGDWHVSVRSGEDRAATGTLHAPVVILSHGSWGTTRADRAGLRRAHRGSDLLAFKADFRQSDLSTRVLPVLAFDGGYGGMVLRDDGVMTLACCVRRDRLDAWRLASPGLAAGEVVENRLRRELGGVRAALANAHREGPWLAAGPIDPGIRLCSDDGPYRIGNAAGEAHPIIGEGMSMAMQSAWMLCGHLLATKRRDPTAQRKIAAAYQIEWRRAFAPRLRLARWFAHVAMRPKLSRLLMSLMRSWPQLLTLGGHWSGKVRCAADPAFIASLHFQTLTKDTR